MQDLRYSFRSIVRMRGVAVLAVATLAIGIAATTTMYSAAYAALLRPLPFPDADRLVLLFTTRSSPRAGVETFRWSYPLIQRLTASVGSYEALASFTPSLLTLSGAGDPEPIDAEIVSPAYFGILGATPALGRAFTPAEDGAPGGAPVAILSDALWRRRYGADRSIVGGQIRISDVSLTVVGIMPPGFAGLSDKAELWVPRAMAPLLSYGEYLTTRQLFIAVVGRLKPGVSLERANAELTAASAGFASEFTVEPDEPGVRWSAAARRAGDARVEPSQRRSVLLLMAAAACVLLITCVDVAGLLLARGRMRARELAIRLAIGSGRSRIVRQLLLESLLLAGTAGLLGAALATWGVTLFSRYAPPLLWSGRIVIAPFAAPVLDPGALAFALGLTLVTTVLCGLAPALETSRTQLTHVMKQDDRGGGSRRRGFRALVVIQVALAVVLLCAAGLLLDSFAGMQRLRQTFDSDNVVTFWVRPPASRYEAAEGPAIVERLLSSVQGVPGAQSAAVNRCTPFTGCSRTSVFFPDRPNDPARAPVVGRHYVSADYFATLGIPLRAGRVLTDGDRAGRPAVTVISESAARRFWPGESPLGKRVWFGGTTGPFSSPAQAVEVVGVVGDVRYEMADWPNAAGRPEFYTSYLQFSYPDTMMMVKSRGPAAALIPSLRRAVATVDAALPIYDVLTLDDRIGTALSRPRFNAVMVAGFAGAALLIAALGVYGMLSYSVSTRLREIGVRLALGADPGRMIRLVAGEGVRLSIVGVAIGLAVAVAAGRFTRSLLVEVSPTDPRILAAVAVVMLTVAGLAALVPARRAAAVDPMVVLRQD